jgi:hypothetical protein
MVASVFFDLDEIRFFLANADQGVPDPYLKRVTEGRNMQDIHHRPGEQAKGIQARLEISILFCCANNAAATGGRYIGKSHRGSAPDKDENYYHLRAECKEIRALSRYVHHPPQL